MTAHDVLSEIIILACYAGIFVLADELPSWRVWAIIGLSFLAEFSDKLVGLLK
jgi:hypothetical protein